MVALEVVWVVVVAAAFLTLCISIIKPTKNQPETNVENTHTIYDLVLFQRLVSTTSTLVLASYTFKSSNTNGCSIPLTKNKLERYILETQFATVPHYHDHSDATYTGWPC